MNTSTLTYLETSPEAAILQPPALPAEYEFSETMPISESQYQSIVENANQAVLIAQDGFLRYVNPKAVDLLGYPQQELISQPLSRLVHESDHDMVAQMHAKRIDGEKLPESYTFRMNKKDGSTLWVELHAGLFSWDNQPATLCFVNDITQRVQTEELRDRLRHVIETFSNS